MKRIKAVYRTIHGDLAIAYRPKKARAMFIKVGKTGGYVGYVWTAVDGKQIFMPDNAWAKGTKFIEEDIMYQTFLQKLQAFAASAKSVVLFIVAPVLIAIGFVFWLVGKNKTLQTQVTELKSDKSVVKDEVKDEQVTQSAITSLANYRSLRDQYLASKKPRGNGPGNGAA